MALIFANLGMMKRMKTQRDFSSSLIKKKKKEGEEGED